MEEIWKVSPRNDNYEVSSDGRVRRRTTGINTYAGKVLTPWVTHGGRLRIGFYTNGCQTNYFVDELVAEVFEEDYEQSSIRKSSNG